MSDIDTEAAIVLAVAAPGLRRPLTSARSD